MRWIGVALTMMVSMGAMQGQTASTGVNHLAGNTVLIVRHAEKPAEGIGLTPAGEARARAYARYFEPFEAEGVHLRVDALYAGADSAKSIRPRLTLEPLSHAMGLPLNTTVSTKNPEALVRLLRETPHGSHPLIAWRHGEIPALLAALGAAPGLLPGDRWPDASFDWVVMLRFGADGRVAEQRLIHEPTLP